MRKYQKYIIGALSLLVIILLVLNFSHILAWILISALVALIGSPIVILLERIRIKKFKTPRWAAALLTLIFLWLVIIGFFRATIPLISYQLTEFQNINIESISDGLQQPISSINNFIQSVPFFDEPEFSTEDYLVESIASIVSLNMVTEKFRDLYVTLWNILLSAFAITFISFFFLKDRSLFDKGVLSIMPGKYEERVKHVLLSVRNLISRYLIGIILQSFCMMIIYTTGLTLIVGLDFELAVLIGVLGGILNVIPYVGPWIGASLAFLLITVANIQADFYAVTFPLLLKMVAVVVTAQTIDNIFFYPLIFSKSVKAHPIEIFILILIAGSIYGVLGMMLAIPTYTVLRVIAREFLSQYKFIRKITQSIEPENVIPPTDTDEENPKNT